MFYIGQVQYFVYLIHSKFCLVCGVSGSRGLLVDLVGHGHEERLTWSAPPLSVCLTTAFFVAALARQVKSLSSVCLRESRLFPLLHDGVLFGEGDGGGGERPKRRSGEGGSVCQQVLTILVGYGLKNVYILVEKQKRCVYPKGQKYQGQASKVVVVSVVLHGR